MKKKLFILGAMVSISLSQASQTMTMTENKRLEAVISADTMNRLVATNDRITQIFGDEGTFESQHDDVTGQIFIKPTAENAQKPLSLTIITENGHTQDLTLKPIAKKPTTLILKKMLESSEDKISANKALPYVEQVVGILKQAVLGQLLLKEREQIERKVPEGYEVSYKYSYQAGNNDVHVFELTNITDMDLEIEEKSFYQPGDRALVIRHQTLKKGMSTPMYVLSYL